ncbi:MAG: hypothetical protein H8E84_04995 [Flavobacteriales bacterium]|nr:hypothetical protein [Flavobacteriales bacterium]
MTNFNKLVEKRLEYHQYDFTAFGEDSIRYDFFYAIMNEFKKKPHEIILEQTIPEALYNQTPRGENLGRGRHTDSPEYDMRVDIKNNQGFLIEFAYFRTPKNATQDRSSKHGKLLNDIYRLALLKSFTNPDGNTQYKNFNKYKCLFICVTDNEMIEYGHNKRGRKTLPIQDEYHNISDEFLALLSKTTNDVIQERFRTKVSDLNLEINAKRMFSVMNNEDDKSKRWATWAWEVSLIEDKK